MKTLWEKVTKEHVLQAIEEFERSNEKFPEAKSTFLVFKNKKYPAKHIRGISFTIANKKELQKDEFTGGKETANFFKKLGFNIEYRGVSKDILPKEVIHAGNTNSKSSTNTNVEFHKIGRIVLKGFYNDAQLEKLLENYLTRLERKKKFEFLITPGGFLNFKFSKRLSDMSVIDAKEAMSEIYKEAEERVVTFFKTINSITFTKLKETADYLTIGIDGIEETKHVELVAIFDLKKEKIIRWTGKFYPTEDQKAKLIRVSDLKSHFIRLNGQNIVILGCHDLHIFSPRGQASLKPDSQKREWSDHFKAMMKNFKPDIILQHPHTTDTPNIWNLSWITLKKEFPTVKHFASGINYVNPKGIVRESNVKKVLEGTRRGNVFDI